MKKIMIDGKPIVFKSTRNTPPLKTIRDAYAKIPDDKTIPVVFQTKTQYLNEYIKNQEKKKNIDFSPSQEKAYKKRELKDMKNIVSRYTTNHNPYIDRRTVFFTDKKITPNQFKDSVHHEYAHELWEQNPRVRKAWSNVSTRTSPTRYGRTEDQEDFAESFMLKKRGELRDPTRNRIISDATSKARTTQPTNTNPFSRMINNITGTNDFSEFDVNHDGKINDYDMNILRKKEKLTKDITTKNSMGEALGIDIPYDAEFGNQFKIWGGQKEYDPRIQDNVPLAQNIVASLTSYKNKITRSGMPMIESIMPSHNDTIKSDLFSHGQELLPAPEQPTSGSELVIASPQEVGRDIAAIGEKAYTLGKSIMPVALPTMPGERKQELIDTLGIRYEKGNEPFFVKAEKKEMARLDALDEQRAQNLRLQQLLLLRNQGLLGKGEEGVLKDVQRMNILQSTPAETMPIITDLTESQPGRKRKNKAYIFEGTEGTYSDNVPGIWHI